MQKISVRNRPPVGTTWLDRRNEKRMENRCAHAQSRIRRNNYGNVDMSRVPILAILGSTGCGKSRLSIELAKRFAGEIISADSMQVSGKIM